MGMNASIISGSMPGSPMRTTRNYMSLHDINTPNRHSVFQTQEEAKNLGQPFASLCFIIQNEKEVIPWKRTTPLHTSDLNSCIFVKLLTRISGTGGGGGNHQMSRLSILRSQLTCTSHIQVWTYSETNIGKIKNIIEEAGGVQSRKETLIFDEDVSAEIDFMDGDSHQVSIENDLENSLFHIQIKSKSTDTTNKYKVQLKLTDIVRLDNGSAYLGFTHETFNLANQLHLENWAMISTAQVNQQDTWSGLSLDYRAHWPLHLILSPDVIEKYNTLFRFLLPIK